MTHAELIAEANKPSCRRCRYYESKDRLQRYWPSEYPDAMFAGLDGLCCRRDWGKRVAKHLEPVNHTKARGECPHYPKGHKLWKDDCAEAAAASERQYFSSLGD